jgi:hypothetical protein
MLFYRGPGFLKVLASRPILAAIAQVNADL